MGLKKFRDELYEKLDSAWKSGDVEEVKRIGKILFDVEYFHVSITGQLDHTDPNLILNPRVATSEE